MSIIELHNVSKNYQMGKLSVPAIKNVSFSINKGEFAAISGPSGSGKSTLLNMIGLIDLPSAGNITLDGIDVYSNEQLPEGNRIPKKLDSRITQIRSSHVGFIFQNFNLIEDLSIIENVALPLIYVGQPRTVRLKNASNALHRFHLGEREYYLPSQLSGGQQQRAAIARAIVSNPEIILADEPTGNLDCRSSNIVMEELKAIHEEGNTIIMVTHNPALTSYATRVINMLDGQIDTDIKTVSDQNLPQPIDVKIKKKKNKNKRRKH